MTWFHRSLPFSIPEVYEGFARAQGLMKVVENELILELEVKEAIFDWIKLSRHSIGIPLAEVESVTFHQGWFRSKSRMLRWQTSIFLVARSVPSGTTSFIHGKQNL